MLNQSVNPELMLEYQQEELEMDKSDMPKKCLFFCNTPYQLIVALQLRLTEFREWNSDIILSDHFSHNDNLTNNLKAKNVFENVYEMESKKYKWSNWHYETLHFYFDRRVKELLPDASLSHYDVFLCANTGNVAACVAAYFKNRCGTKIYMFEDGFVSYSDSFKNRFDEAFYHLSVAKRIVYGGRAPAVRYVQKYFVFMPELLNEWDFPFEIVRIKPISKELAGILSDIYDFADCPDRYSEKYIYFEESYYADGIKVNDVEIVEKIADIVGKENILVKIHPRNKINRFKELGYHTNYDISIPWEVIGMNIDLSEKVLMTIASGSSITSYCMTGSKAIESILLYRMDGLDKNRLTPSIPVFDKVCKNNNYFVFPKTMNELLENINKTRRIDDEDSSDNANKT